MITREPLGAPGRLSIAGLGATAIGFLGAAVDPGPGPRFVPGAVTVGAFYLPPLLTGLALLLVAGLVATRARGMPVLAGAVSAALLVGSFTVASASVLHRLSRPWETVGFLEDSLQVVGEVTTTVAGLLVVVRLVRGRRRQAAGQEVTRFSGASPRGPR